MRRFLLILTVAAVPAGAATITQYVRCQDSILTASQTNLGVPPLRCSANGLAAIADYLIPGDLHAGTFLTGSGASGPLEARVAVDAQWQITVIAPASQTVYWAECLTQSAVGPGIASVSGFLGPFSVGGPCDFAHAIPLQANTPFVITERDQVMVSGVADARLMGTANFFDPVGNTEYFGYRVGPVPEPSEMVPLAIGFVALLVLARRSSRPDPRTPFCHRFRLQPIRLRRLSRH